MEAIWAIAFSPMGVGLYVLFWIFKLTAGAWIIGKIILILPETTKLWLNDRIRLPKFGALAGVTGARDMK